MKKKILVLLAVLLLVALTIQVAFADPTNPPTNPNGGSYNMGNSWWAHLEDPEDPEPIDTEPPVQIVEPDEVSLGTSAWMLGLVVVIGAVVAAVLFVMKGRKG